MPTTYHKAALADTPVSPLALASGHILVGNASGQATDVAMSGDATIDNAGAVTVTAGGNPARSDLVEDALARYPVNVLDCRQADAGYPPLPLVQTLSTFYVVFPAELNALSLRGYDITGDNEQSQLAFEFDLPVEYVSAGDVKLRLHARYAGSGTAGTKTIDAVAYVIGDDGAFASDLVATNAQTLTTSWADYDFTVTATGLTAGKRLMVIVTTSLTESGESNPLHVEIGALSLLLDVKG